MSTMKRRKLNSAGGYLDALQDQYSKLLVVRVDLHYRDTVKDSVDIAQHKQDVQRLIRTRPNKSSPLKDSVGYIMGFEEGEDRGPHCHLMVLYDGQKRQDDRYIAESIGGLWCSTITDGDGTYYNPHRDKEGYTKLAIGMMNYDNTGMRQNIDKSLLPYMLKDEQAISAMPDGRRLRSFVKGQLPKTEKGVGRPRKYEV